ncbi:MAG: S-layer homology domain-containing protein [Chloroflexi bacterium]|nr:S-layer homology domain-containing protein [Chloroflexota bacterium]
MSPINGFSLKRESIFIPKRWKAAALILLMFSVLLAACAGSPAPTPTPTATASLSDPNTPVTRAQAAIVVLLGIHGNAYLPPPATGIVFTDVPANLFGAAWIEQFTLEGITSGCGGGMYCPDRNVTRAQMAIFLLRGKYGSAYVPPAGRGIFTDVPLGSPTIDWVEQFVNEGIATECGTGIYCPEREVTRAEMAVFLDKTFTLR